MGVVPGLVSFVMLVRDRPDYTSRALASLATCAGEVEFVIVDNGSGIATVDVIEDFAKRGPHPVQMLRFTDDAGGSCRRNAGAAAAHGEYLFFIDNDIVADDPTLVQVLTAELSADPLLAAVSPLLRYPGDGRLVQCAGGGATLDGRIGLVGRGEMLGPGHRVSREQVWAPTAALLVRSASFARAGGFDEAFDPVPLCEDVDLCCRMRAAGETIRYVGSVHLRHYEGVTFNHVDHDKLAIWKRHVRVLRSRWRDVFARGPAHESDTLSWRPVIKDYSDPARPQVRLLAPGEQVPDDPSFFARDGSLARHSSVPDLRVGVAGCGQVALRGALPALAGPQARTDAPSPAPFLDFGVVTGTRVTGVADPDLVNLLTAARYYHIPHMLRDVTALLDTVPLEGLVVCTPPEWHATLALAALRRGLPVLVEKPGALSHQEVDALLAAAAASPGTPIAVNLPWAHHPALTVLTEAICSGAAGVPHSFAIRFEHAGPRAWAPRASWYERSGGGVITDLGLHALDAAERIFARPVGPLTPISAQAVPGMPTALRARAEVTVGTCTGTVEVGWNAAAPSFTVRVEGDEAVLEVGLIPYRAASGLAIRAAGRGTSTLIDVPFTEPTCGPGVYAEFARALAAGPPPRTSVPLVANAMRAMISWADAALASVASDHAETA